MTFAENDVKAKKPLVKCNVAMQRETITVMPTVLADTR